VPHGWSIEAADFINKLLRRKSKERLGKGGISELKDHSWLKGIQWLDIYKKEVMTPYLPKEGDNFDSNYCNRAEQVDQQAYNYYLQKITAESFFNNFYFNFYDPKSVSFFEVDNIHYKFGNPHEDGGKDSSHNKVESTGRTGLKSTIIVGSTSTNTPRLDLHSSNLSQQTYMFNNQSHLSHRKFIGNHNI
jgi:hypothetical protein